MKSLKIRLTMIVLMVVLAFAMLIIGVWAVGESQQINLSGNVSFDIADNSLYIKDIRVRASDDLQGQGTTLENFMPGYINGEIDINIGSHQADTSFTLLFDIVNTTTTGYQATTSSLVDGAVILASGVLHGDGIAPSEIASAQPSGTIMLTIVAESAGEVTLDGIVINLDEYIETYEITTNSSDSSLGSSSGGGEYTKGQAFTLSANFASSDACFLGWRKGSENGELVSTLLEFTITAEESANYYAVFASLENDGITYNLNMPNAGEAEVSSVYGTNVIIPSYFCQSGQQYKVARFSDMYDRYSPTRELNEVFYSSRGVLETIQLPQTLTEIADGLFNSCTKLTQVYIPSSIVEIGEDAFRNTGDVEFVVDENNQYFSVINGGLVENATKTLIKGNINTTLPADGSVEVIGDFAFSGSALSSITIPEGVAKIGYCAFEGCNNLIDITISNSVTGVDMLMYDGSNLNYTTYSNGKYLGSFSNPYAVLFDTISDDFTAFTLHPDCITVAGGAFSNTNLTSVTLPSTMTLIGGSTFSGCMNLQSINVPSSVKEVGPEAFAMCNLADELVLPEGCTKIGGSAFAYSYIDDITLPSTINYIEYGAFNQFMCGRITVDNLAEGWQVSTTADFYEDDIIYIEGDLFNNFHMIVDKEEYYSYAYWRQVL